MSTISLYDSAGGPLKTIFLWQAPEKDKGDFLWRLDDEWRRVGGHYRQVRRVGFSDGACDYEPWRRQHPASGGA